MGRRFGVVLSFLFYAMSTIVIIVHHYVFPSIFFIPVAFTLLGFFDSFFSVSGKTFVADSSSARNRGASIGLYTTLNGVCRRSFAPIVAGILFTVYSPITPFIVGLTASMIATVLLTRTTSEVHEDKLA